MSKCLELNHTSKDYFALSEGYLLWAQLYRLKDKSILSASSLDKGLDYAAKTGSSILWMKAFFEKGLSLLDKQTSLALTYFALANYHANQQGTFQEQRLQTCLLQSLSNQKMLDILSFAPKGLSLPKEWSRHLDPDTFSRQVAILGRLDMDMIAASVTPPLKQSVEKTFADDAQEIVLKNYQNPQFGALELCQHLGLSQSQVHRKLKAELGLSPSKFIQQIRLDQACQLLKAHHLNITAIALETGFKDPDYFHRVFKQHFECTPGDYRKQHSLT